jgi:hypothetical protein
MKIINRGDPKFCRCFSMEITAKPYERFKLGRRKYQLFLAVTFNCEHEELVDEHRLRIGLKGGELHLKLSKAEMQQTGVNHDDVKKVEFNRERQEDVKTVTVGELAVSLNPFNVSTKDTTDKTTTSKSTFTDTTVTYTPKLPTEIIWFFNSETVLIGSCSKFLLGIIELTGGYPCRVTATFKILSKHIFLVEAKKPNGNVVKPNSDQSRSLVGLMKERNMDFDEGVEGNPPSCVIGKVVLEKKGWIS